MVRKERQNTGKGALSIKNVTKVYDPEGVNVMAVDDCSMEIAGGEVCMIVGPSGCGKTTLLNAIAGFHSITEGSIHLDGELLCGPGKPIAQQGADRMVVFQHGALFPWKTCRKTWHTSNGPKGFGASEAMDKAGTMLAEAGLEASHQIPGRSFIGYGGVQKLSEHSLMTRRFCGRAISGYGRFNQSNHASLY